MERNYDDHGVQQRNGVNPRALKDRSNRIIAKKTETKPGLCILSGDVGLGDAVPGVKRNTLSQTSDGNRPKEAVADNSKGSKRQANSYTAHGKGYNDTILDKKPSERNYHVNTIRNNKRIFDKSEKYVSLKRHQGVQYMSKSDAVTTKGVLCRQKSVIARTESQSHKTLKSSVHSGNPVESKTVQNSSTGFSRSRKSVGDAKVTGMDISRTSSTVSSKSGGSSDSDKSSCRTLTRTNSKSVARDTTHRHVTPQKTTSLPKRISDKTSRQVSQETISLPKRIYGTTLRHVTSQETAASTRTVADVKPHFSRRVSASNKSDRYIKVTDRKESSTTGVDKVIGSKVTVTKKTKIDKLNPDSNHSNESNLYKHRTKVKNKDDKNAGWLYGADLKVSPWKRAKNLPDKTFESLSGGNVLESKSHINWKDIDSATVRRRRSLIPRACSSTQRASVTGDCDQNDTNYQGLVGDVATREEGVVLSVKGKSYTQRKEHVITGHMEICEPSKRSIDHRNDRSDDKVPQTEITAIGGGTVPLAGQTGMNYLRSKNKSGFTSSVNARYEGKRSAYNHVNNTDNQATFRKVLDSTADVPGESLNSVVPNSSEILTSSSDTQKLRHNLSKIPAPSCGKQRQTTTTSRLSENGGDQVEKFTQECNIVDVSVNTGNSPTVGDRNFTETYGADVHPYCNTDYENKPLDVNNGSEDDYQDVCNQQTSLTADGSNAISKGDAEKSQNIGRESRICRNKNREEQNTRTTKPATDTSYGSPVESSTNLNKLSVTDDLSKTTAAHVSVPADVPYLRRSISSLINDLPRSRDELRRFYEENVEERSPSLIPWRTFSFPDIYMDENSGMLETGDSGQEHTVEKGITKSATCENDLGKIKSSSSNNPQTTQKSQKTGNVRFQNVHKQKTQPNGLIPDNKDVPSKDSGICAEGKQLSPDSVLMDSGGGGLQVFNQEHVKDYGNCQEANTQGVQETGTRPKPTGNRSKLPRNKVSYLAYDNTDKGTGNSYTDKPTSPPPPYGEVRLPVNVHDGTGERFGVTTSYTRLSGSANEACTVTAGPNSAAHFRPSKNNGEALCGVLKGVLSGVRREDTGSRDTHHGVVQENIDTGNNTGSGIGIQWSERTRKTSGVREVRDTNINEDERHIWNINDSLEDIDNTECTGNGVDGNEKKYVVSPHFEKSKIAHKVNVKSRIAYKVNGKSQITHKVNDISESSLKQKAFSVVQTLDKGKYSDVLTSVQHTWNVIPSFSGRNIGVSTTDRTTCDGVIGSDHLVRPRGGTSSGFDNQLACETGVDGGHSSPNQDNPGEPCEGPDPESIKRTDVCYTTPGDLQTTEDVRCDKQQNATGVKMNKGTHSKSSSGTTKLPSGGNITKTPSTRPQSKSESNSSASKTLSKRTIPQAAAIAAKTSVVQAKSDSNSTSSKVTTLKRKGCKAVQTDRSGTRRHETGVKVKLRSSVEIDNRKISRDEHLIPVWRIDKTAHSDRTKVCKTFVDEQKCGTGVVENSRKKRTTTDISNTTSHSGNNLSAEVCSSDVINCQGDVTVNNTVTLSRDKEGYNPTKITARGAITIESPISDIGGTKEKTCTPAKKISSADSKSNLETSSTFTEITDPSDHVSRVGTRSIFHGHDIFPSQYCFSDRGNSPVTENPEVECSSAYDIRYVTWDDCALSDGSEVCTSQLLGINLSTPAINIVTDVSETVRNTDTSGSCKYIDNISVREYKSNNIEAHGDSGLQSVQYGISDQWASYQNEFLHTNVVESDVAADQIGIGRYGDILCPDGFSIPRPLPNDGVGNRNVGGDVEFISNTPAGTECDTYDTRRVSTIHVMSARDGVKVWSGEPDGKDEKDDDENECNLTCNALGTRYGITDEGTDNTSASDGANVWSGEPDGNDNAENECNLAVNALGTRYGVTDEGTDKEPDSNGNKVLSEQSESTGENVCHLTQTSYPDTDEETDMEVDESQCTLTRHASLRDGSNGITNHYDTANLHGVDIGAMTGYNTTSANTQGVNMAPEGPIQSPDIHQPITDCDNEGDNKSVVCLSVVTKTSTGSEGPCDGEKMDTNVQEGMLHDNPGGMVSNLKKAKNTELSANEEFKASGRKPVGLKSKEDKSTGSRNNRSVSKCKQGASNKVFSKSRSLSPQSCLRRDVKVTEDSYVSGTVYRDIPSKEKMTSIRIPRTSTPVSQPRLTASQKPRIPEAREPNRRVSKVVEHLTYEKNPQVSKTKSQSMDSVGRECFDSQQSISGKACNNRDKNSSALSKEKSISRDSSPSLSVSSNVKRPINSRESVSSVTGANKTSLIGKEKKDNINSVNRNTKSSDGTISKYNNTTRNAREPTYRPKSSEQRESSRVVGLQRLDRTDGTKRSQARNITKCNSRLSAGGVGNTHLKSGKREVTTATQFELEKLEKETIQTAMSVKTDTEPIKIPNEIGCEKNKKSQDNKEVRVSDMKPDLDNAMLSSSVTSVCGVSVPSSSIPNSCDPKRQCNTLSKPDITNTKTQRTSDTTGLSDKPSHMKTKSSSTSALPRHRAQSNTQTSSHMHCVKQNRRSAIPSPKPASLSHVSKNHSAQQTHGEVLGNKNKVQQQSGQELPQPRVSKRETSSRVKPVATIHRKTKESSPTDLYKRSRSSTPCDTSSEKSSTVVQRQNTEKMSTSVRNNLLLKPRQSSVPKPTRVKQKPNGNTDKSLEKCKPSNRPSVPKTLLNNSNTRKGINYAEIRPTKTKIEITMTSSPESDTSSPTLTCCDTNDRSEGSPSEGAVRSLESPSEVVTSLSSPYEGMASLPVTPMSPRFLSACSSIGSTPFTTPPEENKCFIVHERTSLKSSDSSTGEDEKIVLNERSLLESNDYLSPCTFDNINNGSEENDKSAGIDDCYPLTDIYNSRCEVSGEHTDITRRRLKTLRKVLKSDIADQSPLSETSHIKDPAAGCRTIVDIASCSENGEQLSNRETSEISTIVPFLTPKNVTELPVDGGGEGHSDGGTTSSDDYFSISEEDEGDNLTKDSVYDALSQHKIDLTGSLDQQASKRCADGCCGNIILKETGTSREYNSLVDICGSDKHQQTNIRKVIVPNLSPGSKGLSQYQNSGVTCANTTDRSIPETTDNGTSSTHYIHTSDLEKQDFECNMYENNTSFDSEFENITHPEKSYLDNVTVYINSQELGKNCVSDNSQNGSSDYEAELPVQANLGEYFDDGEDKLEMQINEHKEGAKDLRGIKRGGGSVETEGTFREIMDDISELSFKNILKHQNQPDGVCSVSNIKPQARLESELLTLDSSVLDVCEEGKSGTKTSEPSDGFGEQHHTDQHEQHVHHHVIEKYTDCQQTEQHGQHVHQHVSGKYTDCQQTEQHGQHVHQHVSGKYTDCQQTEQHGQHVHQHVSGKYTDCQQTEQHGQHVHQHVSGKYTDCQQTEQHGQHVHQHVSGKYTDCQQTEQHEQHTDENLIGNYTNKYGTHYCVSELNVQSKDERDLTDDHHNESPDRVDGGNGVTENEIIGEHFDSDSDIDSEQKYDSDETSGDTDEMNEKRGQCHESNMATIATSTAAATDSVHTPGRALSSRNETCIRKYEIVTTTITRHKKRETKIIESSSNVSTNTARLHEKPVTDHGRNLVNSRRVKFETSKQIISASDVDGNVFSTVKSSTNTATLGHGNSSDTISQASSEKRAALMHGETITMPECLESESIGKVKRCSVDTDTDSGDLQQAISNEEILNYGECDTTVAIPRDNEYRKYKTLEQGPTLSPRLTRYKISNFEDVQNCPPPSPILTRGNFISDRDNPTLSPRLTRGNFISERESPTLSPRLTRGDTKTSVIKSRSSTTQTYNVLRRAVPGDSSISDLSQVIKLGQAGVKACVRRETQTIQSTYQTRPISPNTDTLTSGDTASELSDTGTNTDLKSGGFSQVDSTSVNGDERFMNDNPGTVVALSMISNTPEKIDGTGNIYESYTDSVGDNCSTSTLAITTITETPQVAILVTKELSDSDNDCLSEVDDAEHLKTKRSCDDNELCTDSTNKTSINENDTQSGTEVNVSDDVSSASDDQVIPGVPDIDVTFTITLPGSVCGSEGSTSGRDQSPEIMNIEFNNEVADTTQNASDKGAGAQISNEITVSVNNALHEPSVLSISASNDSETKTILKGTTEDNSEKLTKAQRRENARQPMRRYTATVCLFEREEGAESDDLDMSPPTRPRARSKSPVELKNTASVPESKQQVSVYGNGRVSEMCRNIFQKGSKGTPATSSEEPPASPLTQSPSLSRKKWVRDNGSWKRVTLAEYDRIMAAKESPILEVTSSTEDVSQGQESADDIAPYEEQKCQPGAWLSKNKETTSVIQEELDLHESIPYMDNDAGQAFNDKVFNLDITSEELSSKVVEQSVSIPNEISKSPRNEQNLMDELDAADAKFSVRDIIVKNEEHMIRRDSLKDISKDGVKTPPKTLPKPKHRRKSDITQDKGNQPSDGTGAEVTVDGQTTSDVDPSKDVVDLDRTLTDNAYVHLEGPETVREGLAVRNELVSLVSDNTSGVHTLVKSRDDINDQNAVLAIDNDRENLSELEYKHNGGSSEALSTDSRNVSTHSRISITSDEVCKGMRSTIHGEPGCVENSEVKIDNMVDLNKTSSANASVKVNTDDIAMATEKEISKEDSSPELERMSFAQKLKKAQRRSESKLETMDITRSRRVTDRKVTGTNDHKSTDSKLEICDDRNVNAVRQNYPITVKGENPEMSAPVDDKYIISSPQKLRAIRIKQEIFPKEEPEELKPQAIKKLKAVKISSETFPREEIPTCEKGGKFESRDTTAWLEDAGGRTPTNSPQKDSGFTSYLEDDKQTADSDTSVSQVDYPDFAFNMKTKMGRQLPRRCINPVKFSYGGFNGENSGDLQCKTEADDRTHETPTQTLQRELLSEIVELEENSSDQNATNVKNYRNENERKPSQKSTSPVECHHSNQSPCPSRSYNRSQSLPTGTLSYGGSRIVYKDGHFVIENGLHGTDGVAVVNGRCNNGLSGVGRMCDTQQSVREFMDQDYRVNSNSPHMKHLKRISYSEPQLCEEEDSEDDSEDVSNDVSNVFIENDGNVTVIANESEDNDDHDENATASHQQQDVKKRTKPDRGSKIPRPLSVDENQLISMQDTDPNSTMKKIKKSLRDARARRSKSFREVSDQIDGNFKLKRNSSFKEAQEKGALEIRSRTGSSEYDGESLSRSGSVSSVDSRPKSPGFLQKLLFKRKSFTEKNLKGEQSTKESFMKKMSLKGLFTGKKDKSDLNSTKCNSDEPPTPPIAAFQGDLDIHAVSESAPNSPFSNLKFRRRHTSADLFVENPSSSADTFNTRRTSECNNSSRQPPLPSSRTTDESGNVKFMLGIDFHPKRPISPKPPLMSITRRNSNLSLPSSPLKESPFELTMDNSPNKMDTDSISTCSSLTSSNVDSASVISGVSTVCDTDGPKLEMKSSGTSGQDLETLTALGQGEMTSSNSNDSGIQHDVSVHSSSESLKTTVQDSTSAVVRRRKSPSPRPERPKSEISVRWADLVETTEISPIKRREASQRNKPRPKSDLEVTGTSHNIPEKTSPPLDTRQTQNEDNLELFDELYGEVLDDLESSWEGGSSLKSEMKPFGSQTSILPYNSLQSLDSFRQRQEAMDQKPSKRRVRFVYIF